MSASSRRARVLRLPTLGLLLLTTAVLVVALVASAVQDGRVTTSYPDPEPATLSATQAAYGDWRSPVQVVGIGDSVMAGTHCSCAGPVAQYAHGLADRLHAVVRATDLAQDGGTTRTLLSQVQADPTMRSALRSARVVLVTIGANDLYPQLSRYDAAACPSSCYQPAVDAMGGRLASILRLVHGLRGRQPVTVLVTDYWNVFTDGDVARRSRGQSGLDWSDALTIAANKAISQATASTHDVLVDTWQPFKGTGDPTHLLAADGDHPNSAGVDVFVDALLRATPLR